VSVNPDKVQAPGFGARLAGALASRGPVCVGIDPSPDLLAQWDLPDSVAGLREFALSVIDEIGPFAAAVKPQSAFFERHGAAGIAVLEETITAARAAGSLVVLDAKRGDIGSTMTAYAQAYLGEGPLAADAVTLSPFLGFGSLQPAVELASATGRGVFVLTLTSNPEGLTIQHARDDGMTVAAQIAEAAGAVNAGAKPYGHVGLVIGATVGDAIRRTGVNLTQVNGPILAPGVGAQGGAASAISSLFDPIADRVLVPISRGILSAGRGRLGLVLDRYNTEVAG
jgi:orotidine-5'-phosphate decarboxylase